MSQQQEQQTQNFALTPANAPAPAPANAPEAPLTPEEQKKQRMQTLKKVLVKVGAIVLGAILYSIGVECFVSGNGFVSGGIWGVALMLERHTPLSDGGWIILNAPLLLLSAIFLGWRFTVYTFLFIGAQSGISLSFAHGLIHIPSFNDDQLLAAIAGGVIMGAGMASCLKVGGSSGGTDILSVLIQKKNNSINVAWIIFFLNALVIGASFFDFNNGLRPVILSLILEFVVSKVADVILSGFQSAIRFEIVTSHGKEVQDAIVNKLGRGATVLEARGGYTDDPKTVLVCLIHKRQITAFNKKIREVDPDAFAYISCVTSVRGKGFSDYDDIN